MSPDSQNLCTYWLRMGLSETQRVVVILSYCESCSGAPLVLVVLVLVMISISVSVSV